MSQKPSKQFNSRNFQGQMERELIIGGIAVGLVVGGGLIYLFWGLSSLITSLACVAGFGGLILVVWLFLKVIEIVSRD